MGLLLAKVVHFPQWPPFASYQRTDPPPRRSQSLAPSGPITYAPTVPTNFGECGSDAYVLGNEQLPKQSFVRF